MSKQGMADYLLPAMLSKASGCIVGTGNLTPKTIVKLYELSKAGLAGDAAKLQEAIKLQELGKMLITCVCHTNTDMR